MLNKKKKQLYKYIPSFEAKEETYLLYVKKHIQPIFIKYIKDKHSVTKEEKEILFSELENIKKYIEKWIIYEIKEDFNKKNKIEQKLETLHNKLKYFYENVLQMNFDLFFEENLEFMIESTLLDVINPVNTQYIFDEKRYSNFMYWIHSIVFYKILNFLDNELLKYEEEKSMLENDFTYSFIDAETLLEEKDWEKIVKEILNDNELVFFIPPDIQPLIEKFLLSLKIKSIEITKRELKKITPYIEILQKLLKKKKHFYEEIMFF